MILVLVGLFWVFLAASVAIAFHLVMKYIRSRF